MRVLHMACGPLLILTATAAGAQVTGVVTETSATLRFRPGADPSDTGVQVFNGQTLDYSLGAEAFGSGASFASTSQVGDGVIEFQNGNGSGGRFTYLTSRTLVDISFTNDGDQAVTPTLHSTITPAGLGIYTGPNCLQNLRSCGPGESYPGDFRTFQDFSPDGQDPASDMIAGASFSFRIAGDGTTVYELSGSVMLMRDPVSGANILVSDLGAAEAALAGFRMISTPDSQHEFSFVWDATDLLVDFPAGTILQPGESSTLTYETVVETFSRAQCYELMTGACAFAFSSFGDPVGRGGGINPSAARFAASPFAASSGPQPLAFDTYNFAYPTFRNGVLSFELIDPAPVPEPQIWAALIFGFGLAGCAVRWRRRSSPRVDARC